MGLCPFTYLTRTKNKDELMVRFSKDMDLLKWEPVLFVELAPASQRLCQGEDGALSGTTFTSSSASFDDAGVAAGQVIYPVSYTHLTLPTKRIV